MAQSESTVGGRGERHNENSKNLVLGDGMMMVSNGALAITDRRHVAVRNAIEAHRQGCREALAVPHTGE
jgi:hypothetical protein